mmetsp:Transcript_1997/g.3095  ORF Transcript_1997/g.3095 Transcript_1997/m.3095 type:complete len:203 (-) Transcript_1997:1025-1633(-)
MVTSASGTWASSAHCGGLWVIRQPFGASALPLMGRRLCHAAQTVPSCCGRCPMLPLSLGMCSRMQCQCLSSRASRHSGALTTTGAETFLPQQPLWWKSGTMPARSPSPTSHGAQIQSPLLVSTRQRRTYLPLQAATGEWCCTICAPPHPFASSSCRHAVMLWRGTPWRRSTSQLPMKTAACTHSTCASCPVQPVYTRTLYLL